MTPDLRKVIPSKADGSAWPGLTAASRAFGNVTIVQADGTVLKGQQLAAESLPVVLTAAQLATLTPPGALTNYALEAGGNLAAVKARADLLAEQATLLLIKAKADNLDVALSTRTKPSDQQHVLSDNLPPGAATEVTLGQVLAALNANKDFEDSLWIDAVDQVYIRTRDSAGVITYTKPDGTTYAPVSPSVPASSADRELRNSSYKANTAGTGYAIGDYILRTDVVDVTVDPAVIVSTIWFNRSQGTVIGAPTLAHLDVFDEQVHVSNLASELDAKFGDVGPKLGAASAPVVTATDDANLAALKVVGAGAAATAQRVTLATETLAALGLVGVKGADGAAIASAGNPLPVSGTVTATPSGTQDENLKQVNGVTTLTGAGATGTGSQRTTVAQDPTTVAGSSSLPAGTNVLGRIATNSKVGYLHVSGVAGSKASTPDAAIIDITGDIDLRAAISPQGWSAAAIQTILGKWSSSQKSYSLALNVDGTLLLLTSSAGTSTISFASTVATGFSNGTLHLVRATLDVNNGASGKTVNFYTKETTPESSDFDMMEDSGWIALGSPVTIAGTMAIHNGTADLTIGCLSDNTSPLLGRIYCAAVKNGIGSAGSIATNIDFTDAGQWVPGAVTGTCETFLVWTLSSTAAIRGLRPGNITPASSGLGVLVDGRDAVTNVALAVKASPGLVYGYNFFHHGTALAWVFVYDALAANVVVGTTTPKLRIGLPASAGDDTGVSPVGLQFDVGISIAASSALTGGAAPDTPVVTNLYYR